MLVLPWSREANVANVWLLRGWNAYLTLVLATVRLLAAVSKHANNWLNTGIDEANRNWGIAPKNALIIRVEKEKSDESNLIAQQSVWYFVLDFYLEQRPNLRLSANATENPDTPIRVTFDILAMCWEELDAKTQIFPLSIHFVIRDLIRSMFWLTKRCRSFKILSELSPFWVRDASKWDVSIYFRVWCITKWPFQNKSMIYKWVLPSFSLPVASC